MHPSQHLFRFIKSLDKNEVKYFRAYAKRNGGESDSNALKLFELLLRANEYDEKRAIEEVNVSNFPALKVYLYDMIGAVMLERDLKKKGVSEIFGLTRQAEFHQRKGLLDGMWKKMERAMQLCERYEEFGMWRTLLKKKQTILMMEAGAGYTPVGLEGFDELYSEVKRKARNLEDYEELEDIWEIAQRKGNVAMYETATNFMALALLREDAPRLSRKAEIKYCRVKRSALKWMGHNAEAMKYSMVMVQLLENSPALLNDPDLQLLYIARIHHIGMYAAATGKFEEAEAVLEKLCAMDDFPIPVFERKHSLELQITFEQGAKQSGMKIISQISEGLQLLEFKIRGERKIAYYFQIAHYLLHFGESEKALKWVLKMREIEHPGLKQDLKDYGEILYLVCHFDLGNYQFIIKSEAEKTLGYLKKRGVLTEFEETVIKGLRKCAKADTEPNRRARLARLATQVKVLFDQPANKFYENYFPLDLWIESKISGKLLNDIYRNQPQKFS